MNSEKLKLYQPDVVRLIENSYHRERLFHTYLFHGTKGSLKKEAALYLTSLILCDKHLACETCSACKHIRDGNSTNVFIISPEGESIKKEQILQLEHEFSLKSDQKRIFIIEHIDKATPASANSLLKFLEEANEHCYGILLTENLNRVLPTIQSRSQIVSFLPVSKKILLDKLVEHGIENETALIIATLTKDVEEALDLINDKMIIQIIELVKKIGVALEVSENEPILLMATEGKFLTGETNKQYHHYFIDMLITLQNDKVKYLLKDVRELTFKKLLLENPPSLTQTQEIKILEIIMAVKQKMHYYINMDLAYLQMLIEIARC